MPRMSLQEFEQRLGRFPDVVKREIGKPLKKPRRELRKRVVRDLMSTSIAKGIWGKGGFRQLGKPRFIVGQIGFRFSRSEGGWIFGIRLRGMTALIEQGIPTQPHRIRATPGEWLYFRGRAGQLIRTKLVRHPGSRVRRANVLQKNLDRAWPGIRASVETALDRTFRKVLS